MIIMTEAQWLEAEQAGRAQMFKIIRDVLKNPDVAGIKDLETLTKYITTLERKLYERLGDCP